MTRTATPDRRRADRIGPARVLAALRGYQTRFGDAFQPSALLIRLVEDGKGFKDL